MPVFWEEGADEKKTGIKGKILSRDDWRRGLRKKGTGGHRKWPKGNTRKKGFLRVGIAFVGT